MQSKNIDSKQCLDYLFHPKSIAIIGVSSDRDRPGGGRGFLESLIDIGFSGKLYPIHPRGGEVFGLKIHTNIKDIPDSVDYVISAIPARNTLQLLDDCASKEVKAMHIYASGWGEIADMSGRKLELQLTTIARQKGIRIIGPNCMGLYCPKSRLAFNRELPKRSGPVGFISQSGTNATRVIREGAMRGVYFSKVISYGNASDLNECDFLEYLTYDSETTMIAGYIEGVKEGTRFIKALKQAAKVKPVIFYKAGTSEHGIRAVASHTGAIAGSGRIWESLLKQAGTIQVHSIEELIDVMVIFRHMSTPTGRNVVLLGMGGGSLVQSADECAKAGLNVLPLPLEMRQKLEEIYISEAGGSFRNPIDIVWNKGNLIQKTIEILEGYEHIDLFMMQIVAGIVSSKETRLVEPILKPYLKSIVGLSKEISHRTAVVLHPIGMARFWSVVLEAQIALTEAGFPVFTSTSQAAKAIAKLIEYYSGRRRKY